MQTDHGLHEGALELTYIMTYVHSEAFEASSMRLTDKHGRTLAFDVQSWSPMNKQSLPLRPHTFRTLEELELMANRYTGMPLPPLLI